MTFCYRFFGFNIVSDCPIPGLIPVPGENADICLNLGTPPPHAESNRASEEVAFVSSITTESGEPVLRLFGSRHATIHLIYCDGAEFWLKPSSGEIWSVWPEHFALNRVALYLLGPVLGLMLRLRGVVCLHASGIVVGDRAVLLTGNAGAGKSTTAAAMSRRAHAFLADDIVAIAEHDGKFLAAPAYPYVSLWPESVQMVCGLDAKLPSLTPGFEKQRFSPANFQDSPVPLGGIFVFGERSAGENFPRIEQLLPREQLISLVANSYATLVLPDSSRAEEFQVFGRMVGAVPIRRLVPHSDPSLLSRLCELIEEQSRESQSRAFAA